MKIKKLYKENLIEGVSFKDKYIFNYNYDSKDDLINLTEPTTESKLLDNVYWFGYKFNDDIDSKKRTQFINSLKGISDIKLAEKDVREFICKPLIELEKSKSLRDFSAIIFPRSERSKLVNKILKVINDIFPETLNSISCEVVKNLPQNITFNWDKFIREFEGNEYSLNQIKDYVNNELLPKIHSLPYFSISRDVKPKYRAYIENYFVISDIIKKDLKDLMQGDILIVDDIVSSGSSIKTLVRQIREINPNNNIFIFTLIGKDEDNLWK